MSYKRIDKSLEDIDTKSIENQDYKNKDNAFTRERKMGFKATNVKIQNAETYYK